MSIHFLKEVFLEYFNIENRNFKTHENLYINISPDDYFNPNVSSFIFCAWLCKDLSYNYCAYWEKTFMLRRRELTISLYTIKTVGIFFVCRHFYQIAIVWSLYIHGVHVCILTMTDISSSTQPFTTLMFTLNKYQNNH